MTRRTLLRTLLCLPVATLIPKSRTVASHIVYYCDPYFGPMRLGTTGHLRAMVPDLVWARHEINKTGTLSALPSLASNKLG
jgi:hypothetical protein